MLVSKIKLDMAYSIEGIEVVVHTTVESNGVKGKASEIIGWIDTLLRAKSFSLQDELCGNIKHIIKDSFDISQAEGSHQDGIYVSCIIRTRSGRD